MHAYTHTEPVCGLVILAAGASRRMGHPKQLVKCWGETLLNRCLRIAREAGLDKGVLVLGAQAARIRDSLPADVFPVLENADWAEGMASSIRCGLRGLLARYDQLDAVILLVSDQPFLEPGLLRDMVRVYRETGKKIVYCRYEVGQGVPVLFDRSLFDQLDRLQGDTGARPLIKAHLQQSTAVYFPLGNRDVDTEQDLDDLMLQYGKGGPPPGIKSVPDA
ncbi:MAG TPA: nucleotidyltransferase family protein [Chitinophagaceae bacterium]|nr:nucleotidyltransferase family protein [Chitinophagaceae bacterium]